MWNENKKSKYSKENTRRNANQKKEKKRKQKPAAKRSQNKFFFAPPLKIMSVVKMPSESNKKKYHANLNNSKKTEVMVGYVYRALSEKWYRQQCRALPFKCCVDIYAVVRSMQATWFSCVRRRWKNFYCIIILIDGDAQWTAKSGNGRQGDDASCGGGGCCGGDGKRWICALCILFSTDIRQFIWIF